MGCDIHGFVEMKIGGVWHSRHECDIDRNYMLFAKIIGVRKYDDEQTPIVSSNRGLPSDLSPVTEAEFRRWYGDAHTPGFLNYEELKQLGEWAKDGGLIGYDKPAGSSMRNWFGWCGGNGILSFNRDLYEDVRFVFWFDN